MHGQLSRTEKQIAQVCWDALSTACPQIKLLNNPAKVLCRYDFLRTCFELKRNTYQVMRASKFYQWRKFPAFIRAERRHLGSLTPLLNNTSQLRRALVKTVLRGYRLPDLLIVEYRNTVDPTGIFREYNFTIVDDRIIPQAVIHNRNWI